ncbi:MAG: aldehyde dehydrogenase family protein [Saprospiraceae bacterium]
MELENTSPERIKALFATQYAHRHHLARSSWRERSRRLKALAEAILQHQAEIQKALYDDFHKPNGETDMIEIYPILHEIRHARRNLREWTRRRQVPTSLPFIGSRSYIYPEAKGVALIISPWNFPVNLSIIPLISAIAAGNTVIIKPSENVPHTALVIEKLLGKVFPPEEVAVVQGGAETSQELLKMPFHHIFFTGSERVGKIIMQAAAQHLTSVTLELGGKTPTIVDLSAHLTQAARRIVAAKFSNAGQICISPDHLFVHEQVYEPFMQALQDAIDSMFGKDPATSPSYARVVNKQQWDRLKTALESAVESGAHTRYGGQWRAADRYIQPTLLSDVSSETKLMQEEIFGPLLPVNKYRNLDEVIATINAGPKPLTLYVYTNAKAVEQKVLRETNSGNVCVNNSALHFYNSDLPFGGVNASGIGKSHGHFGFLEFTNQKAVYDQVFRYSLIDLIFPPIRAWKTWLINLVIRWF